jgi:hypothetical protein
MTLSTTLSTILSTALRRRALPLVWLLATTACASSGRSSSVRDVAAPTIAPADAAFLDTLERRTFDWFWETTNPRNGLTPDRTPNPPFASIASVGFALTAYPVGVERGYVSRADAATRVLATLRFFWRAPQGADSAGFAGHHGFFYHFLDMETGLRHRNTELSSIDTALLLGGVLFCQQYFDGPSSGEGEIRALADSLYRRVEWGWLQTRPPLITMSARPERGFGNSQYKGYDEAMLLYLLALGSPTHAIDAQAWGAFTSTYQWGEFQGQTMVNFAPLFGHQYSHVWVDFRGIRDAYMREKGIDYFENSRRATLAQRAYAVANPNGWRDYDESTWGLTASDGPKDTTLTLGGRARRFHTYWARGAARDDIRDDGTLAPTAAGGSIPFAPDITIVVLRAMRTRYGDPLFGRYGFVDAFNPSIRDTSLQFRRGRVVANLGWFDDNQLGIDQGPIVAMIENYRTALVWNMMRRSPYVVRGLCRAGFTGGWLAGRC